MLPSGGCRVLLVQLPWKRAPSGSAGHCPSTAVVEKLRWNSAVPRHNRGSIRYAPPQRLLGSFRQAHEARRHRNAELLTENLVSRERPSQNHHSRWDWARAAGWEWQRFLTECKI